MYIYFVPFVIIVLGLNEIVHHLKYDEHRKLIGNINRPHHVLFQFHQTEACLMYYKYIYKAESNNILKMSARWRSTQTKSLGQVG